MKKTKLNKAHYELKGKMVDFFGWDLPVQYSGLTEEHNAVRSTGGLFDVSHMGEIYFRGPEALAAVQHLTSNNVAKLKPGKIHYSGLMTEKGCFVDDLLVYMISETEFLLVVNAASMARSAAEIAQAATPGDQTNMTRAIIQLKQHEHAAKANMKSLASADKMLGTLLDVKA